MSRLDSHVAAVQRKITFGLFIEWLATSAFVLAVLALVLILLQRAIHFGVPPMAVWAGLGLGVAVAVVAALLKRPSQELAAVAIDEKLSLKEKFSTALVARQMANDPFARAVVRDAEETAKNVKLAGQFPLSFPRAGYWALAAAILALLAFVFVPNMDLLGREKKEAARRDDERKIADSKQVMKEALAKIEAMPVVKGDNESVRIAKAELTEMLKHPLPDPSTARRRVMESLEKVDNALKQKAQDSKSVAQSEANSKMFRSLNPPIDAKGPVADAQRELVKGDYDEAIEDLKKAVENLEKMSPKEKEEAAKQMQQMAQQLAAMAQDPRAMEKVAEKMQQMGANQQQAQQAQQLMQQAAQGDKNAQQQLNQLQQQIAKQMNNGQGANQQQMQQMAQMMQQAQQAANAQQQAGQMSQAAQQMAQAMQQMAQGGAQGQNGQQQMAQGQQQLADMLAQMQAMQQDAQQVAAAQKALQDAMAGACQGNGDGKNPDGQVGQGQTGVWKAGDPQNRPGHGQGGPGQGMGGQGQKTSAAYAVKEEISKSHYDEKGKHLASIYVKDKSVKGDAKLQLEKLVQAGAADEGDDVDDSQADRRTQEVQRKYFKVMEEEIGKTVK